MVSHAGRSYRATEGMWADGRPGFYLCRLLRLEDRDTDRDSEIIPQQPIISTAHIQHFSILQNYKIIVVISSFDSSCLDTLIMNIENMIKPVQFNVMKGSFL